MPLWVWMKVIGRLINRGLLTAVRRRVEVIRYDGESRPRPPFAAPLHIAAVGPRAFQVINELPLVARGTPPASLKISRLQIVEHLRDGPGPHIVVIDVEDVRSLARAMRHSDAGDVAPVLTICLASNWSLARRAWALPEGIAILAVKTNAASKLLNELIYQIAADEPLETAIKNAARQARLAISRRRGLLLVIDKSINDALRLHDARQMHAVAKALVGLPDPPQPTPYAPGPRTPSPATFWDLGQLPDLSKLDNKPGPRSLDINVVRATYRNDLPRFLDPGTTLASNSKYLLAVHIGPRLRSSTIRDEETATSHVQGHNVTSEVLDIVVQQKDFELLSRHTQQLVILPDRSSEIGYFTFRTPKTLGRASMRVMVYKLNKLLQSYLVQAEITQREIPLVAPDRGVLSSLDFSFTADLSANREESGTRDTLLNPALALTINRDTSASHSLFMKDGQGIHDVPIPESALNKSLARYRQILLDASYQADGNSLPPGAPRRWTEVPGDDAKAFIKTLARFGYDLYEAYLGKSPLTQTLNYIRNNSDKVISITRYDEHFAFPWPVLYDMYPPRRSSAEVCFGVTAAGTDCQHDATSDVFCVRGFWGFRHQVEELIGGAPGKEINQRISRGSLRYLADSDIIERGAAKFLEGLKGADGKRVANSQEFLKSLWDPKSQVSLLMLFSHLENREDGDIAPGPRIPIPHTVPTEWLWTQEISRYRTENGPWDKISPVVLLMTCNSSATTPETLTDFMIAFHRVRAGAIIGTECLVLSDSTSRFSQLFIELFWKQGYSLGAAMTEVRRAFLRTGNPLGFAFNCIGRADLELEQSYDL